MTRSLGSAGCQGKCDGEGVTEEVRPELPGEDRAADERTTLLQALDFYRAVLRRKAWGLSDEQLRTRVGPADMTLGGLLVHMANVEDNWFVRVVSGLPQSEPWISAPWRDDHDWDWHVAAKWSAAEIFDLLDASIDRSRAVVAEIASLEEIAPVHDRAGNGMTLRWILNHMVSEYARHCGHADLIRESIDGATGD